MWIWILAGLVGLLALKAKASTTVTAQAQATTGATGVRATSEIAGVRQLESDAPVPPANATTITDAPTNLASAYLVYSTILRNKLPLQNNGTPFAQTSPGAPFYGGGGSGGGRGSIGCPVKGTEILCLGMSHFESSEFEAEEFISIEAGEYKLTATPSHKLFTAERGIVFLGDLRNGDHVITHGGERTVLSVFRFSEVKTALRIHVPESHLYFAGGILSHNKA